MAGLVSGTGSGRSVSCRADSTTLTTNTKMKTARIFQNRHRRSVHRSLPRGSQYTRAFTMTVLIISGLLLLRLHAPAQEAAAAAPGAKLFAETCAGCHGADAKGDNGP